MSIFARTLALTLVTLFATTSLAAAAEPSAQLSVAVQDGDRFDAATTLDGQVNINTATAAELELLPGIGPATSALIIAYRKDHPFKQVSQVMRVKGVGQKTYDKIKSHLSVEGDTTLKIVK